MAIMLNDEQRHVLRGMLTALVVAAIAMAAVMTIQPQILLPRGAFPTTIIAVMKWSLLVVVCLAGNIAILARHRFFSVDDIDGGALSKGTPEARVLQATLQNTLEQAVLAVSTYFIWAAVMPLAWQGTIAVAAILFLIGRLLFWKGYAAGAGARALGFALTFYPSVLMIVMVVVWSITQLFI